MCGVGGGEGGLQSIFYLYSFHAPPASVFFVYKQNAPLTRIFLYKKIRVVQPPFPNPHLHTCVVGGGWEDTILFIKQIE
jgi:hypothetical protein